MSDCPAPTDQNAILMMQFSVIAYDEPTAICADIVNSRIIPPLANTQWKCVWGPCFHQIIAIEALAFVVQNQQSNEYALVIRGTTPTSLTDWDFDVDTWPMVKVSPYILGDGTMMTATGTMDMFQKVLQLADSGKTILQYFQSLNPAPQQVFVTGHSLGGTLTALMAAYLLCQLPSLPVQPYSFAGFTPGNQSLADHLDTLFGNGPAWRYYNSLDVAPILWTSLSAVQHLYSYSFHGFGADELADGFRKIPDSQQVYYQPQMGGYCLSGQLQKETLDPLKGTEWDQEAGFQHSHTASYLPLMLGEPQQIMEASATAADRI
jgi:hypothetical protein